MKRTSRDVPGSAGFLVVSIAYATGAAVAAWLVRRYSLHASGSGIPHVEAVLNEELPQAPFVLAIGSGLALGREGPTVQIWSARNFDAAGPTAECCLPQALAG